MLYVKQFFYVTHTLNEEKKKHICDPTVLPVYHQIPYMSEFCVPEPEKSVFAVSQGHKKRDFSQDIPFAILFIGLKPKCNATFIVLGCKCHFITLTLLFESHFLTEIVALSLLLLKDFVN